VTGAARARCSHGRAGFAAKVLARFGMRAAQPVDTQGMIHLLGRDDFYPLAAHSVGADTTPSSPTPVVGDVTNLPRAATKTAVGA
jgi:hypothetical protein